MRLDPIENTKRTYKYTVKVQHIICNGQVMDEPLKVFEKKMDAIEYINNLRLSYKQMKADKKPSIGGVHPAKIAQVTNIYLEREEHIKDLFIVVCDK